MAYSSVFLQKASELGININLPGGDLLVCKNMLENSYWKLNADHRKVTKELDGLESEIREVVNALDEMRRMQIAATLIKVGLVSSVENILLSVQDAYGHIYAALMTREEGGNTAQVHTAVSKCLFSCRDALWIALQGF